MWLDIFSDGRVYEMEGEKVIKLHDTMGEVQKLLEILDNTEAGTFVIAYEGKMHPTIIATEKPLIRITKTDQFTKDNLVLLKVSFMKGDVVQDKVEAVSGIEDTQVFRIGLMSRERSLEPLPEGEWTIGSLEWAKEGDLDAVFPDLDPADQKAIGPIWIPLTYYQPEGGTERSGIGFHLDANPEESPGTAGCVGIRDKENLAKFVKWFSDPRSAPKLAVVDWGLGTV